MSFGRYSASGDCVAPQHAQVKALHIAVNVVRFAWLLHVICISFALSEVCAYASVTKTTKRHLMQLTYINAACGNDLVKGLSGGFASL